VHTLLDPIITALTEWMPAERAGATSRQAPRQDLVEGAQRLLALLDEGDVEAQDTWSALAPAARLEWPMPAQAIDRAIAGFDFAAAAEALRGVLPHD